MATTYAQLYFKSNDSRFPDKTWTIEVTKVGLKFNKDLKVRRPGLPKFVSRSMGGKVFSAVVIDTGQASVQWSLRGVIRDPTWVDMPDFISALQTLRTRFLRDAYIYPHVYLRYTNAITSDSTYFVTNNKGIEVKINNGTADWDIANGYIDLSIELVEGFDIDF